MFKKKTLIIAEAGVNHNGNLITAKKLVDGDYYRVGTVSASNKFTLTKLDGSAHTYGDDGANDNTFTKVHVISVKGQSQM